MLQICTKRSCWKLRLCNLSGCNVDTHTARLRLLQFELNYVNSIAAPENVPPTHSYRKETPFTHLSLFWLGIKPGNWDTAVFPTHLSATDVFWSLLTFFCCTIHDEVIRLRGCEKRLGHHRTREIAVVVPYTIHEAGWLDGVDQHSAHSFIAWITSRLKVNFQQFLL
jgi:hypothetical protein